MRLNETWAKLKLSRCCQFSRIRCGVQGDLQGHYHVFYWSITPLACLLLGGVIFSRLWAFFMLLRWTTHNSLISYFEMAGSANSTTDVPVSSTLPASTSLSGSQANVPPSSSSFPALSVEVLTASILSVLHPLPAPVPVNQPLVSSLRTTPHTPLPVASSLVALSSAPQLPMAVQTPSTGRSIFVPFFISMLTAPPVSSVILPLSLATVPTSITSPSSLCPTSFSTSTVPAPCDSYISLGWVSHLFHTNWSFRSSHWSCQTSLRQLKR